MKKTLMLIAICASLFPLSAMSDQYIVSGATVTKVMNTYSNKAQFAITVSGGSGVCANKIIIFPLSATVGENKESHSRAYATALTAITTDIKVDVYNYSGSDCNNASFIRMNK